MNRSIEAEPQMSPELRREWTARRNQIPKTLPEANRDLNVGKGPIRRAWDAIPRPVKVIGGVLLIGLGLQYFFKGMADQHAAIGKRTNEAAKAVSGATKATDPVSGLTGKGSVVSNPGSGAIDKNPDIAGSSDKARPVIILPKR